MPVFTDRMLPEMVQPFWAALQRGEFIVDAAASVGTYRKKGTRWVAVHGGVRPRRGRNLKGRCVPSLSERRSPWPELEERRCAASPDAWAGRRRRSPER